MCNQIWLILDKMTKVDWQIEAKAQYNVKYWGFN